MAKLKQLTEQEMKSSKKRFNKLCEYSFVNQEKDLLLDEDDEDPNDNEVIPDKNTGPKIDNTPDNGQEDDSSAKPQEQPQPEIPGSSEDQPNINVDPNQSMTPAATDSQISPEETSNDVEIDVTDLTSKQDDVDQKVSAMADQTKQMMNILNQLVDKVQGINQSTDSEINKIKDEIVKRNPTPVETLQKRITVSDPFTQTPEDYWNKKQSEGHYRLSDDEDENKEYVIKPSDIDDGNIQDIYKSFGLNDDEMNQSLANMFKI